MLYRYLNPYSHSCIHGPLYTYTYISMYLSMPHFIATHIIHVPLCVARQCQIDAYINRMVHRYTYSYIHLYMHTNVYRYMQHQHIYVCNIRAPDTVFSCVYQDIYLQIDIMLYRDTSIHASIHLHILIMVYRYIIHAIVQHHEVWIHISPQSHVCIHTVSHTTHIIYPPIHLYIHQHIIQIHISTCPFAFQ